MKKILLITLLLIVGCGSTMDVPDWYLDKKLLEKEYPDMVLGYGKARLMEEEMSKATATLRARTDLASKLGGDISTGVVIINSEVLKIYSDDSGTVYVVLGKEK